jgi:hypothetical protein
MSSHPLVRLLPAALSLPVALVSLRMAVKGLSTSTWLPFHEGAAGTAWEGLVGMGFLAQFLLLTTLPIHLAWRPDPLVETVVVGVGTGDCIGLGVLTRRLHRETGAATPWKGSFAAAGALALATVLAALS